MLSLQIHGLTSKLVNRFCCYDGSAYAIIFCGFSKSIFHALIGVISISYLHGEGWKTIKGIQPPTRPTPPLNFVKRVMEQTAPPPLPPPLTAITTATTTAHPGSLDSSPRSRNTDSWIEDSSKHPSNNGSTAATTVAPDGLPKLRLMCSYGGHIVPRPHNKSLCYIGGDTRIVVVDRHTTLSNLTHRLTKTLLRSSTMSSFTIKYQLPSEDLDSLISVTTDEDLENMIDEYERLNLNSSSDCNKSSRIRLFLFPTKPESVSSIGSLLESATKSEDWFLNALNGTSSGFSDTSSVNCLLGLEDDVSVPEKKDVNNKGVIGKCLRGNNSVQDVQSVPDSPMLETSSSFGSASSTTVVITGVPDRVLSEDQRLEQQQQPKPSTDSVSSNFLDQNTGIQIQQQIQDSAYLLSTPTNLIDPQNRQLHHQPQFIHTAVPSPQNLHHHHHPSGAVPMAPFYQIHPSQTQHHALHPALDQHNFMYYMPARQPPQGYNLPLQGDASPAVSAPPNSQVPPPSGLFTAPRDVQSATKTELPAGVYRTTTNAGALAPQLVQVPSSQQQILPQFVGYSHIHQPSQPIASGGGGGNYVYEFADPLQQRQHIYHAAQPLPPQSAAQYQIMTSTLPVEAQIGSHLQAANSMNQQVRTSQP
ncbi:hypothetical protein L1987_12079 [Smallanthus sonchifolius]|uniref:Uncharacterized protein n=1 Tax=Smallanthus sonchifolius TaxID=185202 RepID=A0ACB9JEW6_9ASTR|nr:hypothetical protein L1987_12079 [Smallanthus sonchifolius]